MLLIGLTAKSSILIVECARERMIEEHIPPRQAADERARIRYRPVITAVPAFLISMVPLLIATGAGAGARVSISTTVFGDMVLASFIGVPFVTALFAFFEITTERIGRLFHHYRQAPNRAE